MSKLILVTGGARSGKSAFAESILAKAHGPYGYIATAELYDDEMKERVAAHQARRPAGWQTYEVPRQLASVLPRILAAKDSVLLDCITLYASTYVYDHREETDEVMTAGLLQEMKDIVQCFRSYSRGTVIIVTNELGCGIVPMEHTSRLYRDVVGKINQYLASQADEVYLVACGLPLCLKPQGRGL